LHTDAAKGLAAEEAKQRLGTYGPNQIEEKAAHSPVSILLAQFKDFIIWIFLQKGAFDFKILNQLCFKVRIPASFNPIDILDHLTDDSFKTWQFYVLFTQSYQSLKNREK
jgi:magnesium-transporting ATPase (P-type)